MNRRALLSRLSFDAFAPGAGRGQSRRIAPKSSPATIASDIARACSVRVDDDYRRTRLLRDSPLFSSCPVERRDSASSIQSSVNRVRSHGRGHSALADRGDDARDVGSSRHDNLMCQPFRCRSHTEQPKTAHGRA